jgi:FkbM family methyltransferase
MIRKLGIGALGIEGATPLETRPFYNPFVNAVAKLLPYFRSAAALRSPNFPGFPLIPKSHARRVPHSRNAYNSFVLWIQRLTLPAAKTVLDVGANHGDFAQAANAIFPDATVLLFEPLPDMQVYIGGLIDSGRRNWTLVPSALGSSPGEFALHIDDHDDSIGSFTGFTEEYLAANPRAKPSRTIMCAVRTLDDEMRERNLGSIDLLKIDVEGFEFDVLKGATVALQRERAIIIEVSLIRRAPGTAHPLVDMLELLTNAGFQVVEIIPSLFDPAVPWKPAEFTF